MMTGKLSTFIMYGWDVGTIWQRSQGLVSAIGRSAESSGLFSNQPSTFGRFSPSIPPHSTFFTSSLWLKSFTTSFTNQYKHNAGWALGNLFYSFIYLKVKGV